MSETSTFERLLRRDRVLAVAGLLTLCLLAWLYIIEGAGMHMSVRQMSTLAFLPDEQAPALMQAMPGMRMNDSELEPRPWGLATWALMMAMWWVMMIAMMIPSSAPTVLLYARVHRAAAAKGQIPDTFAPVGAFTGGYLLVWLGFSAAATLLHWILERSGLISTMMAARSRLFCGCVLIAAGLYQLSPVKNLCLLHCRAPAHFLARHWRPNAVGALQLGVRHGAYCVGCCWMLMALLFAGGVMNLVWIAALTLVVLCEKWLPAGQWIGRGLGVALAGWGAVTLAG